MLFRSDQLDQVDSLRQEMDSIIAAQCPLCEGSLADLGKSFLGLDVASSALGSAAAQAVKVVGGGIGGPAAKGKGNGNGAAVAAAASARRRNEEEDWAL